MLISTYVNLKSFFYPIGNTPAVNLLRDFRPPDKHTIEVLALACGDVRNVLFSLWSEGAQNTGSKFNFTMCDLGPAVLGQFGFEIPNQA